MLLRVKDVSSGLAGCPLIGPLAGGPGAAAGDRALHERLDDADRVAKVVS